MTVHRSIRGPFHLALWATALSAVVTFAFAGRGASVEINPVPAFFAEIFSWYSLALIGPISIYVLYRSLTWLYDAHPPTARACGWGGAAISLGVVTVDLYVASAIRETWVTIPELLSYIGIVLGVVGLVMLYERRWVVPTDHRPAGPPASVK